MKPRIIGIFRVGADPFHILLIEPVFAFRGRYHPAPPHLICQCRSDSFCPHVFPEHRCFVKDTSVKPFPAKGIRVISRPCPECSPVLQDDSSITDILFCNEVFWQELGNLSPDDPRLCNNRGDDEIHAPGGFEGFHYDRP